MIITKLPKDVRVATKNDFLNSDGSITENRIFYCESFHVPERFGKYKTRSGMDLDEVLIWVAQKKCWVNSGVSPTQSFVNKTKKDYPNNLSLF